MGGMGHGSDQAQCRIGMDQTIRRRPIRPVAPVTITRINALPSGSQPLSFFLSFGEYTSTGLKT